MKKNSKKIYLIIFLFAVVFLWFSPKIFFPEPTPVLIPQCFVHETSYGSRKPDPELVSELGEGYELYGTISQFINYTDGKDRVELSTNSKEYLDKEVYLNPTNDANIYVRLEDQTYVKLDNLMNE